MQLNSMTRKEGKRSHVVEEEKTNRKIKREGAR